MLDTTSGKISGFIANRFPKAQITDSDDIFSLGFINSLFAMELVMFLEKDFRVTIPNEDLVIDNFRTVGRMTALMHRMRPELAAV